MTVVTRSLLARPIARRFTITQIARLSYVLVALEGMVLGLAGSYAFVLATQLLYPANHSLPFQRTIDGKGIGFKSQSQLENLIDNLNNEQISIQAGNKTYQQKLPEMGVRIDGTTSARQLTSYTVSERLKPFSLFTEADNTELARAVETAKLKEFAQKIATENTVAPKNASYSLKADGTYAVIKGAEGTSYDVAAIEDSLKALSPLSATSLQLHGKAVAPAINESKMSEKVEALNALAKRSIMLDDGTVIKGATLASWASIRVDETKGEATLVYDQEAIKAWLKDIPAKGVVAAKPTVISYVDHVEVSRTAGTAGRARDLDRTSQDIIAALQSDKTLVKIAYTTTTASPAVVQKYTASSKGIQLVIEDWQARHKGMKAAVVFKEIGGDGRYAELSPNTSFFAASIYKLYVAKYVYDALNAGRIASTDYVTNGKNTQQCVEAMIVISDNDCPVALANRFGWNNIDAATKADGFTNTSLRNGINTVTAGDTAQYLERLNAGTLLNAVDTNSLLGFMARQIYRSAIPAGSPDSTTYDKVGFYGRSWHDAAIVQSGSTRYVLVVLTEGAGPTAISELAKQIHTTVTQ